MKKKVVLSLLPLFFSLTSPAISSDQTCYTPARECKECCPCPKPLCPQYTCLQRCCCCKDESPLISFDWIYLKPSKNLPSYGFYFPDRGSKITSKETDLSSTEQSVEFKSAFRVTALSPNLADRWQIGVDWVGYYPTFDRVSELDPLSNTVANYMIPSLGFQGNSYVDSVDGQWKLRLNECDLFFRKAICLKGFTMTPYTGVKVGWIKQKVHVKYGKFHVSDPEEASPHIYQGKSDFFGAGPLFGFELCYWLYRGLHLFFKGELAGVGGKFKNTVHLKEIESLPIGYIEKLKTNRTVISDVRHWQAGVEWTPEFGCFAFRLVAGWEGWMWGGSIGIPTIPTLSQPPNESNLSLYGPFIRAGFLF